MNFQGRLLDATGVPVADGLYNMQFKLYDASTGGTQLWTETRENSTPDYRVQVTNGLFTAKLGQRTALSASLFSGSSVYFEITQATPATATCSTAACASWESPMTPRHQMSTSAYAFNSDTLDGLDSTAFAASSGSGNYIQNTMSLQAASNFWISGTGRANTSILTPTLDTATATALNIGTTNATSINLNENTVTGSGYNLGLNGGSLQTDGVTRLTSQGSLTNITNYLQTTGNFTLQGMASISSTTNSVTLGAGSGGWVERVNGGSQTGKWYAITSSSDGTKLAAVVQNGYIYTSADSGATWTQQTGSGSRGWYAITSSSDGTKLAAVEYNGYIYTSTDSGLTWTQQTGSGSRAWNSITSSSNGTKLAATVTGGYIYTSTDSGITWTERTASGTRNWYSITSSSDGTKLAAANGGEYVYTSTDSGATWTQQTASNPRNWYDIASSSDGTKLAAAVGGDFILTSADSGATWTQRMASDIRNWYSITSSSDGTKLAAIANGGYIYTSTDSGATWTEQTASNPRNWYDIASSSDGTKLAAVAYNGYAYTSTDSGATWTQQTASGLPRVWRSIAASSDGAKLAAVTEGGYAYTSTDSGATWTQQTASGSRYWYSITSSSDGTKLAAAVNGGYIYTSTDSGATWTQQTASGSRNWYSITSSSGGTKLAAVAYNGYAYTSTDSGATWTQQTASGSRTWSSIASSSDGTKLAAAASGGYIYTSTDSGATWTQQTASGSRAWNSITSSSNGTKLAATVTGGYIYTSTDSGATWTQQTASGSRTWSSITSSSDGTKLAAVAYGGFIYTYGSPATAITLQGSLTTTGQSTFRNDINSTAALSVQNAAGVNVMNIDTTNSLISLQAGSDAATLSAELFTTSYSFPATTGWSAISGTGSSATATHSPYTDTNSITPTPALSATAGASYLVSFNVSGVTGGGVNPPHIRASLGGDTCEIYAVSGSQSCVIDATSTASLQFIPYSWAGTISNISLKQLTKLQPVVVLKDTTGASQVEIRSGSNTVNEYTTLMGANSGSSLTTAWYNSAFGSSALQNTTSGSVNSAFGGNALNSNVTGSANSAFGGDALVYNTDGSYNTAAGFQSMHYLQNGSRNTAIGYNALASKSTGNDTTGVGTYAGYGDISGSYNSYFGYSAGYSDLNTRFNSGSNLQKATAIGAYAQVQADNSIVLGSVDNATKVGIGITVPGNTLSVSPLDYQTGTATRTNASATLVGTGTTWTSAMVGDIIVFADGTTNTVSAFTDATHITMGTTFTGTTDAAPVYYRFHRPGFNVTSTGNTLIQNTSTAAFAIQSSVGTNFLNVDTVNNKIVLGTGTKLAINGDTRANIDLIGTPPEGMTTYDTTNKQLLTYSNGKWQADRHEAILVAANNSTQAEKDAADYVATGTGDQATINTALTAADPAGSGRKTGKVYLFAGTYNLTAAISVPNNTTLAGSGNATVITVPSSQNGSYNMISAASTTVIRDLKVDGNKAGQTSGTMQGVYLASNSTVSGVTITNIYGATGSGIKISGKNNTVSGNTLTNNSYAGVYDFGGSINGLNIITDNTVTGNAYGIDVVAPSDIISNNVVSGGTAGILISTYSKNIISNNTVESNTYGVYLISGASNNIVKLNSINNNGDGTSTNNGIYLSAADSNTITDNNITDTSCTASCYAINISNAGSDTNYLGGNTFTGDGTYAATINDAGTNTIYAGQAMTQGGLDIRFKQANSTTAFTIQNASGTSLFTADTTNMKIVIAKLDVTGLLTVGGHIASSGTAPTIAAGAAACTTPTVAVAGTDTAGMVTITTGTGCAGAGKLATVTFNAAYGAAPRVTLTAANANASGLQTFVDDATIATTTFDVNTNTGPANSTVYKWYYQVIQ
jgi:parallel beta-helix repeat protein